MPTDFWKGRAVLVTGASGFIGRWLLTELVSLGAEPVALTLSGTAPDLMQPGCSGKVKSAECDIRLLQPLKKTVKRVHPDICFHLASKSEVSSASQSPVETFESNVAGTWNVLEALRAADCCSAAVVASSVRAYGNQEGIMTEESRLLGTKPYDASKACADVIARSYCSNYSLPVSVARSVNTFGGGDLILSRLVPLCAVSLARRMPPKLRGNGLAKRDFIYVKDSVRAYLSLARGTHSKKAAGQAVNFGSGRTISIAELVSKMVSISGADLSPKFDGCQLEGEPHERGVSIAKARELLGWKPLYALEQGLAETMRWYAENIKSIVSK